MKFLNRCYVKNIAAAVQNITDDYCWHKAIWESFPENADKSRDFLFRIEQMDDASRVWLLSNTKPCNTKLFKWDSKEIGDNFWSHQTYNFKIRVNPSKKCVQTHKRVALIKTEEIKSWISRKATESGFKINPEEIIFNSSGYKVFDRNGIRCSNFVVDLSGKLTVTNKEQFYATCCKGVGPSKGFGCGMLLLAPCA